MGQSISSVRANTAEMKQEMEEQLHVLEKMVDERLENEMAKILNGERHDQEIDTGTIVQFHKQINIWKKQKQQLSDAIEGSIKDFFSGDVIGGLAKIVEVGADTVLGNASIGEYETSDMFIVWSSNALLRCDAYYYRWNFTSTGVIAQSDGVVGVLLVKRVIDLTKTDPQVLTWAITNQANRKGDPDEASEMIQDAMKVLEKVVAFQTKLKQLEAGGGKE